MLNKLRLFLQPFKSYSIVGVLILVSSLGFHAKADKYIKEVSASLGMSNVSYAETESKVENNGQRVEAQSGSVSVLSLDLHYKFIPGDKIDYYMRFSAPFLSASGDTYFSYHVGGNYYFGGESSRLEVNESGSRLSFRPKLRYYAGVELGAAYLVFSNELVKRNDVLFNFGFHGGATYTINDDWGIRASLHFARGTGANTTTTAIQFFAGATYFFGAK